MNPFVLSICANTDTGAPLFFCCDVNSFSKLVTTSSHPPDALAAEIAIDSLSSRSRLDDMCSCSGVIFFHRRILVFMSTCIPTTTFTKQSGTHPWLVRNKIAVEGTSAYAGKVQECSEGLFEEFLVYTKKIQVQLKKLPVGSKKWWK